MTTTTVLPSDLTNCMINMGYNRELSAPLIANEYLKHITTGSVLPRQWEASTIKDVQYCYKKLAGLL